MSVQLATAPSHPVFVECVSCTTSGGEEDRTYRSQKNVEDSVSLKDSGSTSMSEILISAGSGLALDTSRATVNSFYTNPSKRLCSLTAWPMKHSGAQGFSTTLCTDAITHHAAILFTSTMERSPKTLWIQCGPERQPFFGQTAHGLGERPMGWRSSQSRAFARFALGIRTRESASSSLLMSMVSPRQRSVRLCAGKPGGTLTSGVIISLL